VSNDVSRYLADPKPGITLDELAVELNELARVRENARVAFCKRLAVAYMIVVGHRPVPHSKDGLKFYGWCAKNIKSANGKQYSIPALKKYVWLGFSKNPKAAYERDLRNTKNCVNSSLKIGVAVRRAVQTDTPPKVIPITKLKAQGMPTDVAREVNVLMTAWEQASSQARSQFMYMITGKRIAA
jgi:hypothetical protein